MLAQNILIKNRIRKRNFPQILYCTHSAIFVSKNVESLPSLLKVIRNNGQTKIYQLNKKELDALFDENNSMFKVFSDKLSDPKVLQDTKNEINKRNLVSITSDDELKLEEESLKYFLF